MCAVNAFGGGDARSARDASGDQCVVCSVASEGGGSAMCLTCGCLLPHEDHGNREYLTIEGLERALLSTVTTSTRPCRTWPRRSRSQRKRPITTTGSRTGPPLGRGAFRGQRRGSQGERCPADRGVRQEDGLLAFAMPTGRTGPTWVSVRAWNLHTDPLYLRARTRITTADVRVQVWSKMKTGSRRCTASMPTRMLLASHVTQARPLTPRSSALAPGGLPGAYTPPPRSRFPRCQGSQTRPPLPLSSSLRMASPSRPAALSVRA